MRKKKKRRAVVGRRYSARFRGRGKSRKREDSARLPLFARETSEKKEGRRAVVVRRSVRVQERKA